MKTAADIIQNQNRDMIWIDASATVEQAIRTMCDNKIGAMLVKKDGKIVGIWTERDLLEDILKEGFDPKSVVIGDYMTTGLQSVPENASVYSILDKFLGMRLRHLLVEKDGEYIGLLSTGDVIKANLIEKTKELEELNAIVSWEYYENWRWKK